MTTKDKAIKLKALELLGEKFTADIENYVGQPITEREARVYNAMHSKAVEVVVGLLEKNKELLEACKAMIRVSDLWLYEEEVKEEHLDEYNALMKLKEMIKQAIAKAEESK